jgi:hypothetical protein
MQRWEMQRWAAEERAYLGSIRRWAAEEAVEQDRAWGRNAETARKTAEARKMLDQAQARSWEGPQQQPRQTRKSKLTKLQEPDDDSKLAEARDRIIAIYPAGFAGVELKIMTREVNKQRGDKKGRISERTVRRAKKLAKLRLAKAAKSGHGQSPK